MVNVNDITSVGRYEIVKKLGQGNRGPVYLGRDPYIERPVAIKIYLLPHDKGPAEVQTYQKKFLVEAQSAGRLMHPNIVTIYDANLYKDFCYLTMEYVDGQTFEGFCKPDTLLPVDKVAKIVFNVCKGLEYAHQNGVIHRDIKPSNLILSSTGQVKITDFSIAYIKRGQSTLEQGLFGSPSYMSPEQVKEDFITEKSDLFSLGAVLYELLTGEKAFDGENEYAIMYKIANDEPLSLPASRQDLPSGFEQILSKALAKDPAHRYQSSMEFAYDLRLVLRKLKETGKDSHDRELLNYIHGLPFFSNFKEGQINRILSVIELVKVEKNKTIIEEGALDNSFYILISGNVFVRKGKKDVTVLEKGECFGEMAYLTGEARSASIITKDDCILLRFSSTLLDKLSESIQVLFYKNFTQTILRRLA